MNTTTSAASSSARPLAGVKVLELSQFLSAPTCGVMLADMGAEVFKIEKFPGGDDQRSWAKAPGHRLPANFAMVNRGKHSVAIDLRNEKGRETLLRLAAGVDVFLENLRPGSLQRMGLGYEVFQARNPRLVYCSISGYGPVGPLADLGGFDLILQAFSGLISITGQPDGRLAKPGTSLADINAGILAAFGIVTAYAHAQRTGVGSQVDTSLLHACIQQLYWGAANYFSTGAIPKPNGTASPGAAPYQVYRCGEGSLALGGVNDANWIRITEVLGHKEWQSDPRFAGPGSRGKNRAVLEALIEEALASSNARDWLPRFSALGVPASVVQDVGQALEHPQSKAIGIVTQTASVDVGETRTIGSPVMFNREAAISPLPAPLLGQHTNLALRRFGFSDEEIAGLHREKIIYQSEELDH
jgi:crotonobetainyl-CoA:carnitine CoA-transferase CaiB-like acyl-CoA transferase